MLSAVLGTKGTVEDKIILSLRMHSFMEKKD